MLFRSIRRSVEVSRVCRPIERLESRAYFSATPSISGLSLINSTTDRTLGTLGENAVLDVSAGYAFSVKANASGAKSVKFLLDGDLIRTENHAPFAIAGDNGTDYGDWTPSVGSHTLVVIPFGGLNGTGATGTPITVHFTATTTQAEDGTLRTSTTRAIRPLGGNLNSQSDRVQDLAFVDLVKTTRGFYNTAGRKASNGRPAFAYTDINGWPVEDFSFTAVDNTEWNLPVAPGTYKMSFKGVAGTSVTGSPGVTPKLISFVAGTGIYTYDVVVTSTTKLTLTFKGTKAAVKNIKLFQPGYALTSTQTFTTKYTTLLSTVGPSVLRFMDWTKANGDQDVNWADRPKVTDATQAKAIVAGDLQPLKGIAWEYCIQLANQINKSIWINVPAHATDDYIKSLAALCRDTLNPSLNIYVEHSNEVWNYSFEQSAFNKNQAVAEVFANPSSNLNYDNKPVDKTKPGGSNPQSNTWGDRRHARRTKQISDIFRQTFIAGGKGDPIASKRVRVILGGQVAQLSRFDNELAYLKKFYGNPASYLYGIGVAPYFNLGAVNTQAGATKAQVLAAFNKSVDGYVNGKSLSTAFSQASANGLKMVAYEGGVDSFGPVNIASKRAASLDPAITGIIVRYLNNWYAKGGDLFNWYTIGARSYNSPYGTWSITESQDVLNSPKIKAFQQVRG